MSASGLTTHSSIGTYHTYSRDEFAEWCASINRGRCYVCNWPLKEAPEHGCVAFNCSERLLEGEKRLRAHAQQGIACAISRGATS